MTTDILEALTAAHTNLTNYINTDQHYIKGVGDIADLDPEIIRNVVLGHLQVCIAYGQPSITSTHLQDGLELRIGTFRPVADPADTPDLLTIVAFRTDWDTLPDWLRAVA
jgi:hypothetical protein